MSAQGQGIGPGNLPIPSDARALTAYTLAATGLVMWTLQTYAFRTGIPAPLAGAVYTLIPGIVGWIASHYTRQSTAPSATPTSTPAAPTQSTARGSP